MQRTMLSLCSGRISAAVTTAVKQCMHYEILEESRSIHPRSKFENLPGKTEACQKTLQIYLKAILFH